MTKIFISAATIGFAAALGLGVAAPAAATNVGSTADTIAQLEAQGHHVQLNGSTGAVPLSQCKVTGTSGLNGSNYDETGNKIDPDLHSTVYVDVVCHNP
ncbi:hypothetical protein H7K45_06305 [Mycobacterium yunnanensis]|uniref:DUF732 domain-containing protein n=1 Tax=Mycobacterium yunnanensis TaxID=368477 RepID=A0A9X2YWV1_9MYCO|nr:hypothetical protein [Mycobacterium yunnanensis]MCV7420145.1 hypothetical protein [Mycobacterium yunnanensis]